MATPPLGTIIFSGSNEPFLFYSPTGVPITPPVSNPDADSVLTGIISLSNAKVAVTSGGAPTFPTTGDGLFAADFLSVVQCATGANGHPLSSISRDGSGFFYGVNSQFLFKYDDTGAQLQSWDLGATNTTVVAVNNEGTIAYYARNTSNTIVRMWDLVGNVSLGNLVTLAGAIVTASARCNNIFVHPDTGNIFIGWGGTAFNYIRQYTPAGALVQTYTLVDVNNGNSILGISPGYTEDTFWVNYYNNHFLTYSEVTISEFDIASGAVLNTFEPEDGTFGFDNPFCVYGIDPGVPPLVISYLWTKISGPGTVVFSDNTILDPTVTFSEAGIYVLRLTAISACATLTDDVTITVLGGDSGDCVLPGTNPTFDCE